MNEIKIQTAKKCDMEEIVKVLNKSFAPVRDYDFDMKKVHPKVYLNNSNSKIHSIIKENNNIVALAGNYPSKVVVGKKVYPFNILGSVATLPECQGKGYMKQIVRKITDDDNKKDKVVFALLTGLRHRYNYFGFEKCGFRYYFDIDKNFCKYQPSNQSLNIEDYKSNMLEDIYNIYLSTCPIIIREKKNFANILMTSYSKIYVLKQNNTIIGYMTYTPIKNRINELKIKDLSLLPYFIKLIIEKLSLTKATIVVNSFDKDLVIALDAIAEEKKTTEQLHFRVYNMKKFLEMAFLLNSKIRTFPDFTRIVKIDNKTYCIQMKDNKPKITYTNNPYSQSFTHNSFLRYSFGLTSLYDCDEIFPLMLDFSYADLF